jgi:argininosuccinate synthase
MAEKLVLPYSGGLHTSVIIRWIKEKYGYDVITPTADVGQANHLAEVAARAATQSRKAK